MGLLSRPRNYAQSRTLQSNSRMPRGAIALATALVALVASSLVAGGTGVANAATGGFSPRGIPLNGQVLLGAATTNDIENLESTVGGTLGLHRLYYGSGQVNGAVDQARKDLAKGRIPWMSFKAPSSWASMATGSGDAWAKDLATKLGDLNGPVWVAINHEPEGDGAAADWKRMQQRLAPIFRAEPTIAYTIILMGWKQFFSNDPSVSMDAYWPGKQYVDVLAVDPYNWYDTSSNGAKKYTWDELDKYYTALDKWRTSSGNTDVPWAVAETGWTDSAAAVRQNATSPDGKTVSTEGTGADWLVRGFDDMKAMGGIGMAYFHVAPSVNNEPADWTWPVATSNKINAFRNALAKSSRFTDSPSGALSAPEAPSGLTASATGPGTIALTWKASTGATSYAVRRNGTVVGSTSGTGYTDGGLTASTSYSYSVTASNSAGTSAASTSASATTSSSGSSSTAVTFRASATATANASQATLTVPSQLQTGDTMVLFASTNTGTAASLAASGWTKAGERSLTDLRTVMWTRVAQAGEAGDAVGVTVPVVSKIDLTLVAYSGATSAEPISAWASRADSANSPEHESPGLVLPDSNSVVLTYWVDKSSSTTSWSLPGGQVRRAQNSGSGGGHLTSVASDSGKASPNGAWAGITATADAPSSRSTTWSVALTSAK